MKNSKLHSHLFILFFICTSLSLNGCATTKCALPEETTINYAAHQKINLNVHLKLSDSIKEAKWDFMKRHTYFLAETLLNNTQTLANNLFENVTISTEDNTEPSDMKIDAVLIPEFLRAEGSFGTWAPAEAVTTVILKWTLKNSKGDILWVDSVKGEGRTISGYGAGKKNYKNMSNIRLEAAIMDLFLKSHHSIYSSPAIQKLTFGPSAEQKE